MGFADANSIKPLREACRNLKKERDELKAKVAGHDAEIKAKQAIIDDKDKRISELDGQAAAARALAAMANINGVPVETICAVLYEVDDDFMSMEDFEHCLLRGATLSDPTLVASIKKYQQWLGARQDGWLKTDQFVRLVCEGVAKEMPDLMRYAGWMFAHEQGLAYELTKARLLLDNARQHLHARMVELEERGDGERYSWFKGRFTWTVNLLDAIKGLSPDGKWAGDYKKICPDFVTLTEQRLRQRQEMTKELDRILP